MKYIVMILHGYDCKTKAYHSIRDVVYQTYPGAEVLLPNLGITTISLADPDQIVSSTIKLIDAEWAKEINNGRHPNDLKVVIIGHSTGALLARKLYVIACGENSEAPFEKAHSENSDVREWAGSVDRIILFAGMNRGWTMNPHLYTKNAILIRAGIVFGTMLQFLGYKPFAFSTRRGAPFITQLRIQWLTMLKHTKSKKCGNTTVIQLLGTRDDIISPEDNIDLVTGANFIYLEVPESDHMNVLNLERGPAAASKRVVFEKALSLQPEELKILQVMPTDPSSIKIDELVTDVVFVIHGIRDRGYWTQKVARRVKAEGDKQGKRFATETSTYGYFAMLPFLISFHRRKKVEWLMDQYTENMAFYPNAQFSFVGHSNGTYLLARALKDYSACQFKHIVLAGSVVQSDFSWKALIKEKRILKAYNFVASSDWVVAMFPKSFQSLGIQDIGSGGFDGFNDISKPYQVKFVKGNHSAAIQESYWDEIAHFIVHGEPSGKIEQLSCPQRTAFMRFIGRISPLPFLLIIAAIIFVGYLFFNLTDNEDLAKLVIVLYCLAIWKIMTTF